MAPLADRQKETPLEASVVVDGPLASFDAVSAPAPYLVLVGRRLRRDRRAMLGGLMGLVLALAALLAPVLAPHDPAEQFRDGLTPEGQPVPSTLLTGGGTRF